MIFIKFILTLINKKIIIIANIIKTRFFKFKYYQRMFHLDLIKNENQLKIETFWKAIIYILWFVYSM